MTFFGLKYIEPNFFNMFIRNEAMLIKLIVFLLVYLLVDFYITVHNLLEINRVNNMWNLEELIGKYKSSLYIGIYN